MSDEKKIRKRSKKSDIVPVTATLAGIRADGQLLVRLPDGKHTVCARTAAEPREYRARLGSPIDVALVDDAWTEVA